MASTCIHEQDLGKVLKYLHRNIVSNIKSYKQGSFYLFQLITVVVTEIKTEPKKGYSITRENSPLILFILFV